MSTRKFILPVLLISILAVNVVERFLSVDPGYLSMNNTEISGNVLDSVVTEDYQNYIPVSYNKSDETQILSWGLRRSEKGQLPHADPGAPEMVSKYGGYYLGDTSKKKIYITFDEGYEAGYTDKILDVLKANNVKALFFITGPYLDKEEGLVKRMVEEGHEVGNHTVNHPSLPTVPDVKIEEELRGLDKPFFEKYGTHMRFFRAPKGEYNERVLAKVQDLGYVNMFWSLAYCDWDRNKSRGAKYAHDIVMDNLHNGAIILLHAVSPDNMLALESIIKDARAEGYEFGSFSDFK